MADFRDSGDSTRQRITTVLFDVTEKTRVLAAGRELTIL